MLVDALTLQRDHWKLLATQIKAAAPTETEMEHLRRTSDVTGKQTVDTRLLAVGETVSVYEVFGAYNPETTKVIHNI